MNTEYDVIVVGAGTAGSFFAKRMAENDYKVLVVDKLSEKKLGSRLDIFHIDRDFFEKYNVPKPSKGDEDYVSEFEVGYAKSAFGNYPKSTNYPFVVMKLHPFLKRLRKWAESFGVEYSLDTEFRDLTYDESGKINGVKIKFEGEEKKISARLVVDCSGIPSVVRRKLPQDYGVETFKIEDSDMFYVILRYVKLTNPEKDRFTHAIGYPYYKCWFAPQNNPNGAIIGVGANLSYEYAEECYQNFAKAIPIPEHVIEKIEKGTTPYRRPPHSFVADGFITLGDSACITKPYSGEGIACAWILCDIAATEAAFAMKNGAYPTRNKLWDTNVYYMRSQGADFANIMATLISAVDCTAEENDYEFKKNIVFKSEDITRMNREFAAKLSFDDKLSLVFKIIIGTITKNIRLKTVKSLLKGVTIAAKLEAHYKAYPNKPKDFDNWVEKAEKLWKKAGTMADSIIMMKENK